MATLTIQPDATTGKDAMISEPQDGLVNYGATDPIYIGTRVSGKNVNYGRGIFSFDVSGVPLGATIQSVVLSLKNTQSQGFSSATFYANRVRRTDWVEAEVTGNQYKTPLNWTASNASDTTSDRDTADQDTCVMSSGSPSLVFSNLKNLTIDALSNRSGILHLLIIGPEGGSSQSSVEIRTSDNATPSNRPALVITYQAHIDTTADAPGVSLGDVASIFSAFTRSEGTAVTLASSGLAAVVVNTADSQAVSLGEARQTCSFVSRIDTLAVHLIEAWQLPVGLSRADTLLISAPITDVLQVQAAVFDTFFNNVTEVKNLAASFSLADSPAVSLAEAHATTAGLARSDSPAISLGSAFGVSVILARAEAPTISLADVSAKGVAWFPPGKLYVLPDNRFHYTL